MEIEIEFRALIKNFVNLNNNREKKLNTKK